MFLMSGIYAVTGVVVAGIYIKKIKGDSVDTPRTRREVAETAQTIREQVRHG